MWPCREQVRQDLHLTLQLAGLQPLLLKLCPQLGCLRASLSSSIARSPLGCRQTCLSSDTQGLNTLLGLPCPMNTADWESLPSEFVWSCSDSKSSLSACPQGCSKCLETKGLSVQLGVNFAASHKLSMQATVRKMGCPVEMTNVQGCVWRSEQSQD